MRTPMPPLCRSFARRICKSYIIPGMGEIRVAAFSGLRNTRELMETIDNGKDRV